MVINQLVFEVARERFDEGLIIAVPGAAYGSESRKVGPTPGGKRCRRTGCPDPTTRFPRLALAQAVRRAAIVEKHREDGAHGPADHPPSIEVEDVDQIQPASAGEDIVGIGDSDFVGSLDLPDRGGHLAQLAP